MLTRDIIVDFKNLNEVNDQLNFQSVMDGLVYCSDEIRATAVNQTDDVDDKNCALNNLHSIIAAMNYIAQTNKILMSAKNTGGVSC